MWLLLLPLLPLLHLRATFFWVDNFEAPHKSYTVASKDHILPVACYFEHMHSFFLDTSRIKKQIRAKNLQWKWDISYCNKNNLKKLVTYIYPIAKSFFSIVEKGLRSVSILQMCWYRMIRMCIIWEPIQGINIILL